MPNNLIQIINKEDSHYEIWDDNELVCDGLSKEEIGEAVHRWLCIPVEEDHLYEGFNMKKRKTND